jgi:hypothetical protein
MADFFCKCCGSKSYSVASLTSSSCSKNPEGSKHALYEGSEKPKYTCKYCGTTSYSIASLTGSSCSKNPSSKKYHSPAM